MRRDRCGAARRLHVTDIGPLRASVPASAAVGRAEEALVGGPLRATRALTTRALTLAVHAPRI